MRLTATHVVVAGAVLSLCSTVGLAGEEAIPPADVPAPVTASLAKAYPGWVWTAYAADRAKSGAVFLAHGEPGAETSAASDALAVDVSLTPEGRILRAKEAWKPGEREVQRLVDAVLRELPERRVESITRTTVFTGDVPDVFAEVVVDDGKGGSVLALRTFEVGAARTEWQRVECASASGAGGASEECWALVTIPPDYEVRVRRVPSESRGGKWRAGWTTPPEESKGRPARPAPAPAAGSQHFPAQARPGEVWCLVAVPAVYETRERDRAFGVEEVVGADGKIRRVPLLERVAEQVAVSAGRTEWRRNDTCAVPMPFWTGPFPGVKPAGSFSPSEGARAPAAPGKAPTPGAACGTGKCS